MIEAFPLYWPVGYKRTNSRINSRFKITMDHAQRFARQELKKIGATDLIISSNIPVRKDGLFYSDWMSKKIDDPGVAFYFKYNGKNVSMCCDTYHRILENIYALGKGIEALRSMKRWGVSDFLNRAFTGFTAIEENIKSKPEWMELLGLTIPFTEDDLKKSYREKAFVMHPDKGGKSSDFILLNEALALASNYLKEFSKP